MSRTDRQTSCVTVFSVLASFLPVPGPRRPQRLTALVQSCQVYSQKGTVSFRSDLNRERSNKVSVRFDCYSSATARRSRGCSSLRRCAHGSFRIVFSSRTARSCVVTRRLTGGSPLVLRPARVEGSRRSDAVTVNDRGCRRQ